MEISLFTKAIFCAEIFHVAKYFSVYAFYVCFIFIFYDQIVAIEIVN